MFQVNLCNCLFNSYLSYEILQHFRTTTVSYFSFPDPAGDHQHHAHNPDPVVSAHPSPLNRSRKVSIVDGAHGHDNPAFESPSRKISSCSDHANIGPVRKKSMLHKQHSDFDGTSVRNGKINKISYIYTHADNFLKILNQI